MGYRIICPSFRSVNLWPYFLHLVHLPLKDFPLAVNVFSFDFFFDLLSIFHIYVFSLQISSMFSTPRLFDVRQHSKQSKITSNSSGKLLRMWMITLSLLILPFIPISLIWIQRPWKIWFMQILLNCVQFAIVALIFQHWLDWCSMQHMLIHEPIPSYLAISLGNLQTFCILLKFKCHLSHSRTSFDGKDWVLVD